MAFSKIAGFEVTPETPSSITSRSSAPERTKSRARKSSQTDCPSLLSALSLFMTSGYPLGVLRTGRGAAPAQPRLPADQYHIGPPCPDPEVSVGDLGFAAPAWL